MLRFLIDLTPWTPRGLARCSLVCAAGFACSWISQLLTGWLLFSLELGMIALALGLPMAGISIAVGLRIKRASRPCLFIVYVIAAYYLSSILLFRFDGLDYPKVLGMAWRLRQLIPEAAWASFVHRVPPVAIDTPRFSRGYDPEIAKFFPDEVQWLLHRPNARSLLTAQGAFPNVCLRATLHLSLHRSSGPGVVVVSGTCPIPAGSETILAKEDYDSVDIGPRIEVRKGLWVYCSNFRSMDRRR